MGVCSGAVLIAEIGFSVGPFLGQGAIEPFNFAVGLGPVGSDESMLDVVAQGVIEQA